MGQICMLFVFICRSKKVTLEISLGRGVIFLSIQWTKSTYRFFIIFFIKLNLMTQVSIHVDG